MSYDSTMNNISTSTQLAPLYPQAILLPIFAFPAWILCVPPLVWHFGQGNIAAGSAISWISLNNFYNSINPLIWPRDNLVDWWDGNVWCDIGVRIQVGTVVGLASSIAMIVRKLAKVMDTRNITMSSSRNSKLKEKAWEVLWCWGYPLLMIVLFYIVQPVRYLIFGIVGCVSGFDSSWPSIVLSFMWGPVTMCVAALYASKSSIWLNNREKWLTLPQYFSSIDSIGIAANSIASSLPATPQSHVLFGSSSCA